MASGMAAGGRLQLTYADCVLFPADGKRHEREGDALATPLLPGLSLALADVFAD